MTYVSALYLIPFLTSASSLILSINLLHDNGSFRLFSLGLSFVLNMSMLNSSTHFSLQCSLRHYFQIHHSNYHKFPEYSSHSKTYTQQQLLNKFYLFQRKH